MVGTPALQVAQKVGVMNDAGEVGVLVIDAEGEEVPAIVRAVVFLPYRTDLPGWSDDR